MTARHAPAKQENFHAKNNRGELRADDLRRRLPLLRRQRPAPLPHRPPDLVFI